jgi:hypothetical protein
MSDHVSPPPCEPIRWRCRRRNGLPIKPGTTLTAAVLTGLSAWAVYEQYLAKFGHYSEYRIRGEL